jgi:amidophosphoribosyltransferase
MCGLAGAIGVEHAADIALNISVGLANRGRSGCGGVSVDNDGKLIPKHMHGSITDNAPSLLGILPGKHAIYHNRYGTSGSNDTSNLQPHLMYTKFGRIALAHNGNMERALGIRTELLHAGVDFRSNSDTEVILKLIARSKKPTFEAALKEALTKVSISYCLLILREGDGLYAIRDPSGNRRLWINELGTSTYFASEDGPFRHIPTLRTGLISEIKPGELVYVSFEDPGRPIRTQLFPMREQLALCKFEPVYFARPDTSMPKGNPSHQVFRAACGEVLAKRFPLDTLANPVIDAVPSSGIGAARGFARHFGLGLCGAIIRNHYSVKGTLPESFTASTTQLQIAIAEGKFIIDPCPIEGKDLILVDDSIVRGTTLQVLIGTVRAMGANSVHIVSASPPVIGPCNLGISIRDKAELIYPNRTESDVARIIDADSVTYMTLEEFTNVLDAFGIPKDEGCDGCFSGCYPALF